ncbi:MAG: hypothetical protein SGPRY_013663, partial [Prymnesium sp.]
MPMKTSFLNEFLERAHIAAAFFVILSGFGMFWGQSTFSPVPSKLRELGPLRGARVVVGNLLFWYASRLGRLVLATWVTMLFAMLLERALYGWIYKSSMASCFFFLELWLIELDDFDAVPSWQRCPNTPAWYIAALIPCWLLFPLFIPVARACKRFPGSFPLWTLLLLLCGVSYLPVLSALKRNPLPVNLNNYMWYFPPTMLCDFFAGASVAALAKAHQPSLKSWLALPSGPHRPLHRVLRRLLVSLLVDASLLSLGFLLFQPLPEGDDENARKQNASLYHLATLPIALFLYGSVASGGLGLLAALFRWPAFVAIGRYSLHAYLFQMPLAELYAYIVSAGTKLQAQNENAPPWR